MNILFINSARTWGGTEKWVRMAAESLSASHKVSLVYRTPVIGNNFSIRKYQLPCVSHIDPYTLLRIVTIIKKDTIDILVPTKRKDYVLAGLAAKICNVRNVLRLGIVRELKIPLAHKLIYHTLTDGIIVNSQKIKHSLLKSRFMNENNIRVIHNGLDTKKIDHLSAPPAATSGDFIITAMGTLTYRKGFDFLIRSFSRFLKLFPNADARLVIIGDGPLREKLLTLAENLSIGNHVTFTGFRQNPYPLLAASDVFALTSTNEGISNALLEAMYLGNAPVSTYAGGSQEVISDEINGFMVNYGNENKLAETFARLFSNHDLTQKTALNAKERVKQQFSLPAMTKGISTFLEEILQEKT